MNSEYIKAMDPEAFLEYARPELEKSVKGGYDLGRIAALVQSRIELASDIPDMVDFFDAVPDYDLDMYNHKKMKCNRQTSLEVLKKARPLLEECRDFSNDALYAVLSELAASLDAKIGYVMWPLRTAVSGKQTTPGGATQLMEILGKEESLARIDRAVEALSR